MSDLARCKQMFDDFGIEYTEGTESPGGPAMAKSALHLLMEAKSKKVEGYSGFVCYFEFDEGQKFLRVSIWE